MFKNLKNLIFISFAFYLLLSNALIALDSVSTSVIVPPRDTDYQLDIASLTDGSTFPQNSTLEYQITYGSNLDFAYNLTLTATWSKGTIDGDSTPTQDVLDYVVGSATTGYGSTSPVVDTVNKKITWTFSSFPGNTTNKTVNFKLKTNDNYTGSKKVNFSISSFISTPGFTSTSKTDTKSYQYSTSSSSSNTSTSTPTPTPTASVSPAPTTLSLLSINSVDIRAISQSQAEISIQTSNASKIKVSLGKTTGNLNEIISSASFLKSTIIDLDLLDPDTTYYFKVYATDENNNQIGSDIFTFKTALISNTPHILSDSFIAAAGNVIVSKPNESGNLIVLPSLTNFEFKFSLESPVIIKKAVAIVRGKNVLGIDNFDIAEASSQETDLIQIQPGIFSGRLRTYEAPGNYEIFARIEDVNGNITEQKIADLTVVPKFKVLSKNTNNPIEGARILIYFLNPRTNKYEVLPPTAISILNPSFTDSSGEVPLILPPGNYSAHVSEIGYKDQNIKFVIGPSKTEGYPTALLEKTSIGIGQGITFITDSLSDVFIKSTAVYVQALTGSIRFFNLIAELTLGILVLLGIFAFATRTHIPIYKLPEYLIYFLNRLRGRKENASYVAGIIRDSKGKLIDGVHIYLVDLTTEEIVGQTKTNKIGHFLFNKSLEKPGLIAMKKGFKTSNLTTYQTQEHMGFEIMLEEIASGKERVLLDIRKFVLGTFGLSFEFIMVSSIIFEFLFMLTFGLARTLPFLTVSLLNLFIWIMYLRVRHHSLKTTI